jgi:hypothetical protein
MIKDVINLKKIIIDYVALLAKFDNKKKMERIFASEDRLPKYNEIPKPFIRIEINDIEQISQNYQNTNKISPSGNFYTKLPYSATIRIICCGSGVFKDENGEDILVSGQDLLEKIRYNFLDFGNDASINNFYDEYLGDVIFLGGMSKSEDVSYPINDDMIIRFFSEINIQYWITKEKVIDKLTKVEQPLINFNS